MLDGRQVREDRGQQRQQRAVDDDDAVGGVVDDPDQLLDGQPQVQRVEHGPHGRYGQICLDMLRVVPHEGRHTVTLGDSEVVAQGAREPGRPGPGLGEAAAARGVRITGPGGDLRLPVDRHPVVQDAGHGQRYVLHGAQHGVLPNGRGSLRGGSQVGVQILRPYRAVCHYLGVSSPQRIRVRTAGDAPQPGRAARCATFLPAGDVSLSLPAGSASLPLPAGSAPLPLPTAGAPPSLRASGAPPLCRAGGAAVL